MRSAAHLELVRGSVTTAATLAHERTLPVDDRLTDLVPAGALRRGSTLAIHGTGATSLALAMCAQAVREGSFLAVVAPTSFSLASCLDFDIPLRRVVQFVLPAEAGNWAQATAAIIEGFDVVMIADRRRVGNAQARQLVARNRERGSVLVRVGGPAWPDAADLRFDVGPLGWSGLGQGHGHLRSRRVAVQVAGRRHHGRRRSHEFLLPAVGGGLDTAPVTPVTPVVPMAPVAPAAAAAGRYAGADIDALLDVVDGRSKQAEGEAPSGETDHGHDQDWGGEWEAGGWDVTA